jgi:phosphopantothenoylcysteine synthetase/decarboxylase
VKILLGVTGSIAACKAPMLVRVLVKAGHEVRVILTRGGAQFTTALALATLSRHPVLTEFVQNAASGEWANHVELGLWADLLLIAPASADTVARLANGHCQQLLDAVYLSARCPVAFAPAMDLDMYVHPAVQQNFARLRSFGNHVIEAATGELASGLIGQGRMPEPEELGAWVTRFFA